MIIGLSFTQAADVKQAMTKAAMTGQTTILLELSFANACTEFRRFNAAPAVFFVEKNTGSITADKLYPFLQSKKIESRNTTGTPRDSARLQTTNQKKQDFCAAGP